MIADALRLFGQPAQDQAHAALGFMAALALGAIAFLDQPMHERELLPATQVGGVRAGDAERTVGELAGGNEAIPEHESRVQAIATRAEAELAQCLAARPRRGAAVAS